MTRKDFRTEHLRLYLVTDRGAAGDRDIADIVSEAVKGGVSMVQLREKDISTRDFIILAERMKKLLSPLGIPLLINDRLDVALAVDADGVHIGQSDMRSDDARRILGPDKIIGLSIENEEQAREANGFDIDYIGISPVYDTGTKTDTATALGLEGVRRICAISRFPAVGIGGMNSSTAEDVMANGADGVAVVSAIMGADNPESASRGILQKVEKGLER